MSVASISIASRIMSAVADPPKRGRPPLSPDGHTPARVEVLVSSADYDRAYHRAKRDEISIPELLRRGLKRELERDDDDR